MELALAHRAAARPLAAPPLRRRRRARVRRRRRHEPARVRHVARRARSTRRRARSRSVVPEPDDDAVRILTVHGAKGLEFPVVVLAGLGVADRNVTPMVLWDRDGCPQVQIGPRERRGTVFRYRSAGYESLSAHEQRRGRGRADPVAVRRRHPARDHLAVSLHHRAGQGSHAAAVARTGGVGAGPLAARRPTSARRCSAARSRPGPSRPTPTTASSGPSSGRG